MKTYEDEIQAARLFSRECAIPRLTKLQLARWKEEARSRQSWIDARPGLHNAINTTLFAVLLAADVASWWLLSRWTGLHSPSSLRFWLGAALLGLLHGWLLYNITSVSLHEGAGHGRLIHGRKRIAGTLRRLLNNLCRLGYADPEFYRGRHPSHHAKLGTEEDGAFTHLVRPGRVILSLLPFAGVLSFNDYRIHVGGPYSRSRAVSDLLGTAWLGAGVVVAANLTSWLWALLVFAVLAPWATFTFDRLRETTDHALLPTDCMDAARSLGLGFWGWLLGPGPWGQCSHLVHHLFPALPWYQQALMHPRVARDLTVEQRRHYLVTPVIGFPLLFARVLRESGRRIKEARANENRIPEVRNVA